MRKENGNKVIDRLLFQMACGEQPRLNLLQEYLKASRLERDLRLIQKRENISVDALLCIAAILADLKIRRNRIISQLVYNERVDNVD